MSDTDTSPEAIERACEWARFCGRHMGIEPLIRALVKQRDAAMRHYEQSEEARRAAVTARYDAEATRDAARAAALEEARLHAMKARFGPPSTWARPGFPVGWHMASQCTPHDAAMHDNGCVDAAIAIRALAQEAAPHG